MAGGRNVRARLRAATEDDVAKVLEDGAFMSDLVFIDDAELLEFFNRMIDVLLGEDED